MRGETADKQVAGCAVRIIPARAFPDASNIAAVGASDSSPLEHQTMPAGITKLHRKP